MTNYILNRPLLFLSLCFIGILLIVLGAMYVDLSIRQNALSRQGVHMSKWDIWVLSPQVRVVNGQTQVVD